MNFKHAKNKTRSSDKTEDWASMLDVDGKANDVTAKNYHRLSRAFANHHARHKEDVGKTINPMDNPDSWGAWVSYFRKISFKKISHMKQVGVISAITADKEQRELHGYQIPAKFPSDFDAGHDWVLDKAAGEIFMSKQFAARAAAASIERNRPPLQKHGDFTVTKINEIAKFLIEKGISKPGWVFTIDGATTAEGDFYTISDLRRFMFNQ